MATYTYANTTDLNVQAVLSGTAALLAERGEPALAALLNETAPTIERRMEEAAAERAACLVDMRDWGWFDVL